MANQKGSPKKQEIARYGFTSLYIAQSFVDTFESFKKLSSQDLDERFVRYCKEVEGEDIHAKGQGKKGIYTRWVLTEHVIRNIHKLKNEKVER